ncbi:MAG: hypothetical protein IPN00_06190 [Hydrogenophilales bacterium]|jgi:hypothetical protein|nr:hypothetical protein [Hydrogenophilales bacterium]
MPEQAPPPTETSAFEQRHATWAMLHDRFGPARSYPFAWRLPELARDQGRHARLRAALALGQTLYAMGRFREALASLPDPGTLSHADEYQPGEYQPDENELAADLLDLHARCLWLQDETADAPPLAEAARSARPRTLHRLRARVSMLCLTDAAEAALTLGADYRNAARVAESVPDQAWAALFLHWARARLGRDDDPAPAHAALALLRGIAPVDAARAQALHAEAAFHVSPAWALTWLDEALEQIERHGQHHLKARLLELKARALEANGLLGASSRFLELARETARRQGAWRYLHRMAV